MKIIKSHAKTQRGTTLIETLVALVVLSIGLLGIAALQMTSLRNNRGAHQRAQAEQLAYEIVDRMRANRTQALAAPGYTVGFGAAPGGAAVNQLDLQAWKASLALTLPGGDGRITRAAGTNIMTITVTWTDTLQDQTGGGPSGVQTFTSQTEI